MQKTYLFSLQIVITAANCISIFPIVSCSPVAWAVQEEVGKPAANYLRISYTRLKKCASFRIFTSDFRTYGNAPALPNKNLQPALLFAMKIGKLFALTGFNN